jgi:hypothetical protein
MRQANLKFPKESSRESLTSWIALNPNILFFYSTVKEVFYYIQLKAELLKI